MVEETPTDCRDQCVDRQPWSIIRTMRTLGNRFHYHLVVRTVHLNVLVKVYTSLLKVSSCMFRMKVRNQ